MLFPGQKPSSSYSLLKFVYVSSQLYHSFVVHPLLRKILDPPCRFNANLSCLFVECDGSGICEWQAREIWWWYTLHEVVESIDDLSTYNVEQKMYLLCSQIPMNTENLYMEVCTRVCGQMVQRNVTNFQTIHLKIILENLFHRIHQGRSFVIIWQLSIFEYFLKYLSLIKSNVLLKLL